MIRRIKNSILPLAVAAALFVSACSDLVEPESLDVRYPSFEETNPELYAQYMQSLREYKAGAHKVVFLTLENPADGAMPVRRNQHLTSMPDSVDFISLNNPAVLHPMTVDEIRQVHEKGTRTIYDIDFGVFESDWTQQLKGNPQLTEQDALAFITERTEEMLAYCDRWGFDGLSFSYAGRTLESMNEADLAVYTARQNAFLDPIRAWRQAHASHVLVFRGNAAFLVAENRPILTDCGYIIVPTNQVKTYDDLTVSVLTSVMAEGVPTDRIVVTAQTTRPGDDKQLYGYMNMTDSEGQRVRSIRGCADWSVLPSDSFAKCGLMIEDAQYDYYNLTFVYPAIREAIGIMNPSL